MNVIIANENKELIDKLNIDVIKRINGQYSINDLKNSLINLYYNKMILDITSIISYDNPNVIKELADILEQNKVIILLNNNTVVNSSFYLSKLVENGFYNFTSTFEGITFLLNKPNTLDDVSKYLTVEEFNPFNETIIENTGKQVIGLVNLTNHAGASSLVNMLVRQANEAGIKAKGVEISKQDLIFYHDANLSSCFNKNDLENFLKANQDADVIFIDVNDFGDTDTYCDKILYLIEPSYIMLTKLMKKNKNVFLEHKNDLIILNKSFVKEEELKDFEYETKSKVFFNMPTVNDRDHNLEKINELLQKIGLSKPDDVNKV